MRGVEKVDSLLVFSLCHFLLLCFPSVALIGELSIPNGGWVLDCVLILTFSPAKHGARSADRSWRSLNLISSSSAFLGVFSLGLHPYGKLGLLYSHSLYFLLIVIVVAIFFMFIAGSFLL